MREYLEKGKGDKAIGFCVSIKHAERMAEVFNDRGITAAAIHSASPDRDALVKAFRDNQFQVAFTVDIFNEGVDFPNVQVLLFLRPTESKTVFLQQLGRGLRLCVGKDRVRILDFIGKLHPCQQKSGSFLRRAARPQKSRIKAVKNGRSSTSTPQAVKFTSMMPSRKFLIAKTPQRWASLKTTSKKPISRSLKSLAGNPAGTTLDAEGEYKSSKYAELFGSWMAFLRAVGEYTEASYHYPQGTHLGHILSILYFFGSGKRTGSPFDDKYIRLRGGLGEGRLSTYRRQVKYKLQAAMELKILTDDRHYAADQDYTLELTPLGRELYEALTPLFGTINLDFPRGDDGIPLTTMEDEGSINGALRSLIQNDTNARSVVCRVFLQMHAVQQMLAYLYHIEQKTKNSAHPDLRAFFPSPVRQAILRSGGHRGNNL